MPAPNRVYSMMSLAAKAGKIASGGFMTENSITGGKAYLVVIAEDASENTQGKFRNKCSYYDVPCIVYGEGASLGHAIGKESRMTIAVTDPGFADQITKLINRRCNE